MLRQLVPIQLKRGKAVGQKIVSNGFITLSIVQERFPKMQKLKLVKKFGQYVEHRRRKLGLTQEELARRVGLSTFYIDNLERGIDPTGKGKMLRPPREVVDNIAKALGWSQREARQAAEYEPPDSSKVSYEAEEEFELSDFASLYDKYQKLSAERQKEFQPVLEMLNRELSFLLKEQEEEEAEDVIDFNKAHG
jgi:transcriptional regulator with XRE-family HTH domain